MRVMVLGDTHGDIAWCAKLNRVAGRAGVRKVIQVGDLGYWPRMTTRSGNSHSRAFLDEITRSCRTYGVEEWIVIDGNHDDHAALQDVRTTPTDTQGMHQLVERVRFSPRGNTFELAGTRIGTLGGAVSLDAWLEETGVAVFGGTPYRRGWNWFPDLEAPTAADVERLGGPLDLLLAHEAPAEIDLTRFNGWPGLTIPPRLQALSRETRELISIAVRKTKPRLLIHGHWHQRYHDTLNGEHGECQVHGLASNSRNNGRDQRAYLILDLPDLTVKTISSVP